MTGPSLGPTDAASIGRRGIHCDHPITNTGGREGQLMSSLSPAMEGQVLISWSSRKVTHLSCSLNIFLDLDFFPGLVEEGATPSPKPCPSGSPTRWPSTSTSPAWTEASCRSVVRLRVQAPWGARRIWTKGGHVHPTHRDVAPADVTPGCPQQSCL